MKKKSQKSQVPLVIQDFRYIPKAVISLLANIDKHQRLVHLYAQFWNPINYAVVGGIGVIINFTVWLMLSTIFPWWIVNTLAILCAWSWNWANSVGPLGYLWGFKKQNDNDIFEA